MRVVSCAGATLVLLLSAVVMGGESDLFPSALQQLAVESEAVVVVRVGSVSSQSPENCAAFALWIVRSLKGRLRGGREIIWIAHNDLPGATVNEQLWLLFLKRDEQAVWTTLKGPNGEGLIKIGDLASPVLGAAIQFVGYHGEPPDFPELPCVCDLNSLVQQAASGDLNTSREAMAKLSVHGPAAIPVVEEAELSPDRQIAAVGRTVLPLVDSGPPVNGMRLGLRPAKIEFHDGDQRVATVNFCNITLSNIFIVTGETLRGEAARTVTAFDVFRTNAKLRPIGAPLPGVLTMVDVAVDNPQSHNRPIVHTAPRLRALPLDVALQIECSKEPGKKPIRLSFPLGYVELPDYGSYILRAHLDCPGPRPDQQDLVNENFWGGGQLVSNDIIITVAPNTTPPADH